MIVKKNQTAGSVWLLILVTIIWGSAFIPQKTAMESIDPLFFSAVRLFLGVLTLLPILFFRYRKRIRELKTECFSSSNLFYGSLAGVMIALGIGLQQIGLEFTKVSKAGFLTSVYILLVPTFLFFAGQKIHKEVFIGGSFAMIGIYLLSFHESFSIEYGDFWVLLSSAFWALHIIVVGYGAKKVDSFLFSVTQFFFGGLVCFGISFLMGEKIVWEALGAAKAEIFYCGSISIGIAYTLQVIGQKKVRAEYGALIFSLESVFATLFEMIFLSVFLSLREFIGILLIFFAVLYSQKLPGQFFSKKP